MSKKIEEVRRLVNSKKKRRLGHRADELSAEEIADLTQDVADIENDGEAELQKLYFAQLEEELQSRERELTRLRDLERNAGPEGIEALRRLVAKAEAAVSAQEQRVNGYLQRRPWLRDQDDFSQWVDDEEVELTEEHPAEPDWRSGLLETMQDRQAIWHAKLDQEQERRVQKWRQEEQSRMEAQFRQLEESLTERQRQLEQAWSGRLQSIELDKLRQWMNQEREQLLTSLHAELAEQKDGIDQRGQLALKQLKADLQQLSDQIAEKQKQDLHLLEIEWREQEILQRERPRLQKMWAELLSDLSTRSEAVTDELMQQLLDNYRSQSEDWFKEQAARSARQQQEWLVQVGAEQAERDRSHWQAQEERITKRTADLLATCQAQLTSELERRKESLQGLVAEWKSLTEEKLQEARARWQTGQEEHIAAMQRAWSGELEAEIQQAQEEWLRARQSWSDQVARDLATLEQQLKPEIAELLNNWINMQSGDLEQKLGQFTDLFAGLSSQMSQLLTSAAEQTNRQSVETQAAFDIWLKTETAKLIETKRLLAEQAESLVQSCEQAREQLKLDQAAALQTAEKRIEYRLDLADQTAERSRQELTKEQNRWFEQAGERLSAAIDEHQSEASAVRSEVTTWLGEQTKMLTDLCGRLEQQGAALALDMRQSLQKRLDEQVEQQRLLSSDLIDRYGKELVRGQGELMRVTTEQLENLRSKTEAAINARLAALTLEQEQQQRSELAARIEQGVVRLTEQTEEACADVRTHYEEQLVRLTTQASQQLLERLQQAQATIEQAQQEHFLESNRQLLEQQKVEMAQVVGEADQRLLEQLRQQIRSEIKAELEMERQEKQAEFERQADERRQQRSRRSR